MRHIRAVPPALAALVLALSGCASTRGGSTDANADSLAGIVGLRWQLTQLVDDRGRLDVPSSRHAQVGFTRDGHVLGDDTVNALQGNYERTSGGYRVSDSASTLVGSIGLSAARQRTVDAMDRLFFTIDAPADATVTVRATLGGDRLTLRHDSDVLTFVTAGRQPDFFAQSPSPTASGGHTITG